MPIPSASPAPAAASAPPPPFPLKEYFTQLAYLSLLLPPCVVLLPRSSEWIVPSAAPMQRTSLDRPEHPLLTSITASPTGTAAWAAAGIALVMGWWGGKMAKWWGRKKDSRAALLATLGTTAPFHALLSLLGAPIKSLRTLLLAATLACLTAYPVAATVGIPSIHDDGIAGRFLLTRLICGWDAENSRERALAYPVAGTLIGAWVGAVPILLDWDRPWQAFPLTPLVGALLGFLAGSYASYAASALESLRQQVADEQAANVKPAQKKRKGRK